MYGSYFISQRCKWRVLGANSYGQLELISADPTSMLYLANDDGYIYAKENLDKFCNDLYGKGTNNEGKKVAIGARSLNIEDINKLTNYDPNTYEGYGYKGTWKWPTDAEIKKYGLEKRIRYKTEKQDGTIVEEWRSIGTTTSTYQYFRLPEDTTTISESNRGSREIIYTYYTYSIKDNLTVEDGYTEEKITEILNMIRGDLNSTVNTSNTESQWLASSYAKTYGDGALGVIFVVRTINWKNELSGNTLFYSYSKNNYARNYVRPVVTLLPDVTLTGSGDDVGSSTNMWQISVN